MATHTLGYAPEDPIGLVESCYRAIEWILATHTAKGVLIPRPWVDHPYGEEEITLCELDLVTPAQPGVTGPRLGGSKVGPIPCRGAGLNTSAALCELRSPSASPNAPSCRSTHEGLHRLWAPLPVAEKVEGRVG